ncbi:dihydroorotase [Altererythrobacter aquiaggeris]|uniref:dihydroorotase n=1 Tax=Aestuarierythrobacter aquiaggeris TaxID=1898396 RepID=UPI003015B4F2
MALIAKDSITLRRPDDWHVHLRDGKIMKGVVGFTASQFARAIVMPNLSPPVTSAAAARDYGARIRAAIAPDAGFTPLMTCYLTDSSDPADIAEGYADGAFVAAKLYPANATTNSAQGVSNIAATRPALEKMQEIGMPLLVHGEVTDEDVDIFDREAVFIERTMRGIIRDFPALKVVFEHITTADAVQFIDDCGPLVAATITPQHLHINRNAMLVGGIRPHAYCLPVAKRERHRLALRAAATSGSRKYFLGTDSAPHSVEAKQSACGCAGIFNAPYALESYASVFDEENALDKFEGFASEHGPGFYGMPPNQDTVTLERVSHTVPDVIDANGTPVVPFHAGEEIAWRLKS